MCASDFPVWTLHPYSKWVFLLIAKNKYLRLSRWGCDRHNSIPENLSRLSVWKGRGSCCCPGWSCRDEEMSDSRVGLPRALRFFYWQCPPPEQQCVPISAVCPQQQFVQLSLGCPLDDGAVPQTLCWVRLFQGNSTAPTVQPARLCWGKNKNHRLYPP